MRQRNPTNIQMAQNLTIDGPQMYLWLKIPAGSKTTTFTVLWDVGEYFTCLICEDKTNFVEHYNHNYYNPVLKSFLLNHSLTKIIKANYVSACSFSYQYDSASSWYISSPGYPGPFPDNLNCSYVITIRRGLTANMSFNSLGLSNSEAGLCSDYVQVFIFSF